MKIWKNKGQHNQFLRTEAVWNIPDPFTVVPTCQSGRPVQVPTGVTCVRRHRAVGSALRLRVRAVVNIGREIAHLEDKKYISCHVLYNVINIFTTSNVNIKKYVWIHLYKNYIVYRLCIVSDDSLMEHFNSRQMECGRMDRGRKIGNDRRTAGR